MSNETDRYSNLDPISTDETRETVLGKDAKKSKISGRVAAVGLAGVVGVGVAGGLIGMNLLSNSEDDGATGNYVPPSEAPVVPGQNETEPAVIPTETPLPSPSNTTALETAPVTPEVNTEVQSYEIEAGLSDEELANRIIEIENEWMNAGATPKTVDRRMSNVEWVNEREQFASLVAAEESEKFVGLFPEDFRTNSKYDSAKSMFDGHVLENSKTIGAYLRTLPENNHENIEPYRSSIEIDHIYELDEAPSYTREVQVAITYSANFDKNIYEPDPNFHPTWNNTYVLETRGDKEVIIFFSSTSR